MEQPSPRWSMVINCADIETMSAFWCGVLNLKPHSDGAAFRVLRGAHGMVALQVADDPVTYRHQMHVDIYCATADKQSECERVVGLGARYIRDSEEADDPYVVYADPEGNEFCICPL